MPTREEEFQAGKKEPKGKPLCPNCGGDKVSPSTRRRGWWVCGNENCDYYKRKVSFPSPSYGARGKPSWFERLLGKK